MKHTFISLLLVSAFVACRGEDATKPSSPNDTSTGTGTGTSDPMGDHGAAHELGSLTVAGFSMTVTQFGDIEAGKEGAFDFEFAKGTARPDTARAWVGLESGVGSRKGKLMKEPGNKLHGHVEVPEPMSSDSRLWVEIELDAGTKRGSVALHR